MSDQTLTPAQVAWMQRHWKRLERWQSLELPMMRALVRKLMQRENYEATFGDMPFDEAVDRYETMLETGSE